MITDRWNENLGLLFYGIPTDLKAKLKTGNSTLIDQPVYTVDSLEHSKFMDTHYYSNSVKKYFTDTPLIIIKLSKDWIKVNVHIFR